MLLNTVDKDYHTKKNINYSTVLYNKLKTRD